MRQETEEKKVTISKDDRLSKLEEELARLRFYRTESVFDSYFRQEISRAALGMMKEFEQNPIETPETEIDLMEFEAAEEESGVSVFGFNIEEGEIPIPPPPPDMNVITKKRTSIVRRVKSPRIVSTSHRHGENMVFFYHLATFIIRQI
jgi:hypothetical protein